ncbi:CHAT domain-containing protein [Streptomyces sp. NPDC058877]|uniref:CHAT domain-containing tetratricopeptide repeat protein n=1 Tax=unclassified Streptomyces TaxID=2593676 RepID=UPI003694E1DC
MTEGLRRQGTPAAGGMPSPENGPERGSRPDDFDRAVDFLEEAVRISDPEDTGLSGRLLLLSDALRRRYRSHRDPRDLDAAVERCEEALRREPGGEADRTEMLWSLGRLLELRAFRTGSIEDAEASVASYERALPHCPVGSPHHGDLLDGLGIALLTRYDCTGRLRDLDTAVERLSDAVRQQPGSGADHGRGLARLSEALLLRYGRTEERADLLAAVGYAYTAFDVTPAAHSERPARASDLGEALRVYYDRTRRLEYLEAGIGLLQDAVAAEPDRSAWLYSLGVALHRRYDAQGVPADLDLAVTALEAAAAEADTGSMSRLTALSGLAIALHARASHSPEAPSAAADLDLSVTCLDTVLRDVPAGRPARGSAASSMASALMDRHARTGSAHDRAGAIRWGVSAWEEQATDANVRITAALVAARMLAAEDPDRAADLAEAAITLLPQIATWYSYRADRQHMLSRLGGSAGTAAALALGARRGTARQRAERAFQTLEAGRAVLLGHVLGTRGDLAELSRIEPELVRRFKEARRRVEDPVPGGLPPVGDTDIVAHAAWQERIAREQRQHAAELDALTQRVRDRLTSFGEPPTLDEARAEAAEGAVVMLNVSALRSDALLLTADGVVSVRLPALTPETVTERVSAFRKAIDTMAANRGFERLLAAQDELTSVLGWLWDAVAEPVLNRLGHTREPGPGDSWPRLWWAPGGALGLLPLHAAGHHTGPERRSVLDRVVCSYTPTLRALRHAREQTRRPERSGPVPHHALLVAMPVTPGLPGGGPLHQALEEVARVRRHFGRTTLLCNPEVPAEPAADGPAVGTEVLARLPGVTVAHFACHGITDGADPSRSRLLLHDHEHSPLTVQNLLPAELDNARLAYLSACGSASSTARGGLSDEAIHLTSAFQLVGFPHVIGSLWDIDDRTAATVADTFYAGLRSDSAPPDTDRAAHALHGAVRGMRDGADLSGPYDRTRNPYLWAAYLHAGA